MLKGVCGGPCSVTFLCTNPHTYTQTPISTRTHACLHTHTHTYTQTQPPEAMRGTTFSMATDVYSFGVVSMDANKKYWVTMFGGSCVRFQLGIPARALLGRIHDNCFICQGFCPNCLFIFPCKSSIAILHCKQNMSGRCGTRSSILNYVYLHCILRHFLKVLSLLSNII